jgi:hypothetical protein
METRSQTATRSPRNRDAIEPRSVSNRSAVTNGKRLFVEGDGRSPWSRRFYDLIALHVSDMGGRSNLSEAQIALIKRASTLEVELEQMEGKLSLGQEIDLDLFARATGNLRRVWDSLGLKREARDITAESEDEMLLRLYAEESAKLDREEASSSQEASS